jgi:hypothetical protein
VEAAKVVLRYCIEGFCGLVQSVKIC